MLQNPLFKFFETKEKKKVAPITILCTINDDSYLENREVERIRGYCVNNNLGFRAREYNIDRYYEDIFVKRFPTFHIYYKGTFSESCDFTDEPLFKIKERIEEWENEEKEKARRKEQWDRKKKMWKRKWLGIEERPPTPPLPKVMPYQEDI
jgi:hypothetical protein